MEPRIPTSPEDLIEMYLPMCRAIARKMKQTYGIRTEDMDDVTQVAIVDLAAIPENKYGEPAYCKRVILNSAIRTVRTIQKHVYMLPIDAVPYPSHLFVAQPSAGPSIQQTEASLQVNSLMRHLNEEQRALVSQAMGLGSDRPVSVRSQARASHTSQDNIRVKLESAMAKMRRIAMSASAC